MCALLEFGGAHGLAYRENYQEDIQNFLALKQLQRQSKIDAENRLKLIGDTQYADTSKMNKWDADQVTQYANGIQQQIGKIVAEHPNPMADPSAFLEIKRLQHMMLDNEAVRQGMQNTSQIDAFNKYRATTPGTDDLPEMQKMTADLKRYTDTGTIDPTGREKVPFQFADPLETFDMGGDLTARAKVLGKVSEWDASANNGIGGFVETNVPDGELDNEAYNIAHVYKDAPKYRVAFNKLSPNEQAYYGMNNTSDATRAATMDGAMRNWIKGGLKARTDQKIQPIKVGQPRVGAKASETGLTGYSPFVNNVQNFSPGVITHDPYSEELATTVNVGGKTLLYPSEPLKFLVDEGKMSFGSPIQSYRGIPIEAKASGRRMNDSQHRTMLEYNGILPLNSELSNGDTPLLKRNTWYGQSDPYDGGDYEDQPSTQQIINVRRNDKGDKTKFANVTFWYPASTDPSHTQEYDKANLGQKGANETIGVRMQSQQFDMFRNILQTAPEGQKFVFGDKGSYVKKNGELVAE